jgi:hypothetical protein
MKPLMAGYILGVVTAKLLGNSAPTPTAQQAQMVQPPPPPQPQQDAGPPPDLADLQPDAAPPVSAQQQKRQQDQDAGVPLPPGAEKVLEVYVKRISDAKAELARDAYDAKWTGGYLRTLSQLRIYFDRAGQLKKADAKKQLARLAQELMELRVSKAQGSPPDARLMNTEQQLKTELGLR